MATSPLGAAFTRALGTSIISALSTGLATYQTGADNTTILATTITAFITPLITRGGVEGAYDKHRDELDQVQPADVGSKAKGELLLSPRQLWAEVESEFLPIIGLRTNHKTNKIEYLVQGAKGEPYFVDRIDRTFDQRPNR